MHPEVALLDLSSLHLGSGEGRRLELAVRAGELSFGGEAYLPDPEVIPVALEVSRLSGPGYALRLTFEASVVGPCMRCLKDARPTLAVEAREVDVADGDEELSSPYVEGEALDLSAWVRDALVLAMPAKVLCREDCLGLCPVCAADLNEAGADHHHEPDPDPRLEKLRELLR